MTVMATLNDDQLRTLITGILNATQAMKTPEMAFCCPFQLGLQLAFQDPVLARRFYSTSLDIVAELTGMSNEACDAMVLTLVGAVTQQPL